MTAGEDRFIIFVLFLLPLKYEYKTNKKKFPDDQDRKLF